MSEPQRNIDALLSEQRTFPPPQAFRDSAVVADPAVYEKAAADHEAFWAEQAGRLAWSRPWDSVMERDAPWVTWFKGGRLNASVNCLDRHIEAGGGEKVAFLWEGEPGDARTITYAELLEEVCRLANALRALGIRKGDRVNIYLGMAPRNPPSSRSNRRSHAGHRGVSLKKPSKIFRSPQRGHRFRAPRTRTRKVPTSRSRGAGRSRSSEPGSRLPYGSTYSASCRAGYP